MLHLRHGTQILLEPDSVNEVEIVVPEISEPDTVVQEEPALTEDCTDSPADNPVLRVAVTVCAAVFVLKSLLEEPVSALIAIDPIVVVGAVKSIFTAPEVAVVSVAPVLPVASL
jgi:hypothetical protein